MYGELTKLLKLIRVQHGEKQRDMAKKLGYSASFLSSIECGKKSPPHDFVERLIVSYKLHDDEVRKLTHFSLCYKSVFKIYADVGTAKQRLAIEIFKKFPQVTERAAEEILQSGVLVI